jgi:hypothetical protein
MPLFSLNIDSDDLGIVETVMFGSLPSGITITTADQDGQSTARNAKSSLPKPMPLLQQSSGIMGTIVASIF